MNYWIRCNNCGKVGKYPYSSETPGDITANKDAVQAVKEDGWLYAKDFEDLPGQEFCCEECRQEWNKHYIKTGAKINLPAAYRFQEQLKGNC